MISQQLGTMVSTIAGYHSVPPSQSVQVVSIPFKPGDKVRIKKDSQFVEQNVSIGDGVLTKVLLPSMPMFVKNGIEVPAVSLTFTNGYRNTYPLEDIELATKPKKLKADKVAFDSVILHSEKKDEIKAAISQVDNTDLLFDKWGFGDIFEKGTAVTLLFYGVPGTGKTLMAQAVADSLQAELKIYGTGDIESSEPGGAERAMQKIFAQAKEFFQTKKKHQVILFDECDALLYDRNKVGVILAAQINALLTEIERHDGIIIFTTNRLGTLDPALERRIAAKIEFPFPTKEQREAIWIRMIPKKAPIAKDVDFVELAKYPLAGGNIKNAVLNAARMAAYKKAKKITMEHFLTAIEREAESQKAFESEHHQFYGENPQARQDLSMGVDRKLQVDSVLKGHTQ